MTPEELAQTKRALSRVIASTQLVLESLNQRRRHHYAHDEKLRGCLEPYLAWHRELLARMERDGDAYDPPPLPAELQP